MVAVWPVERSIWVLLKTAVAVLIVASSFRWRISTPENHGSIPSICVLTIVLGEGQECFLQSRGGDLQSGKCRIASQQNADHGLRFRGMDLCGLAVSPGGGYARNLKYAGYVQRRDAADSLTTGLRFDLCGRAFSDNLALIDDGDAVGESVSFFQIMRSQ